MRLPAISRVSLALMLTAVPLTAHTTPGGVQVGPGQPMPPRDARPGDRQEGTAAIRGYVVAADTGAPVRRAQVRVFAMGGGANAVTQTDAQGRFEILQLPAGRFTISVARSGYVSMQFGQRAPNQPGTPIELADGQVAEKVNFLLARGGAISGRIVDEFGEPVSSVQVGAQRYAYMNGARRLTGSGGEGGFDRTDDLGQFRLHGLPPGEYYVSATLRTMDFVSANTSTASAPSDGYAPTYFPGTPSVQEARRVTVRVGQDVTNVSFSLSSAKVGRIFGRVTTSGGEPYIGGMLMVSAREQEAMFDMSMSRAQLRPDGTFQTGPLTPGNYTVTVEPMGNRFDPNVEVGRVDVAVNGEDVRDVFIVTGRGGIIRGRVVTDDGQVPELRPQQMRIFTVPEDPTRPTFFGPPSTVKRDWTFEVTGLTDRVRLRWSADAPGGGWSLKSAMKDGVDLADTAVDAGPGQVVEGVEIVLTRKVTELSGLVSDDNNRPVTDATIVIFPGDRDAWTPGSRYVRMSRPDTNGKYTLRLTPADGYRAVAVRRLEDGQFSDPEFLGRAVEHATAFEIREGEAKVLDLKLAEP